MATLLPQPVTRNTERAFFWEGLYGICYQPRKTIQRIVDHKGSYGQLRLMIALIGTTLETNYWLYYVVRRDGPFSMVSIILFYMVAYGACLYASVWILWALGKIFNGKASDSDISTAIVWPLVPAIACNLLIFVFMLFFGFQASCWNMVLGLPVSLFCCMLMVGTLAQAQQFSLPKSFFIYFLPLIILSFLIFSILTYGVYSSSKYLPS